MIARLTCNGPFGSSLSLGGRVEVLLERQQHLVKEFLTRAVFHINISRQLRPARYAKLYGAPEAVLYSAIGISEVDVCSYEIS